MHAFTFASLLVLVLSATPLRAQLGAVPQTTRDLINHNGLSVPSNGTLYGIKGESGKLIGTSYFDTTWQTGTIKFYGKLNLTTDSLPNVPIRLDLYSHDVEVRAGANDIRVAKAPTVHYVVLTNQLGTSSRFINVREYRGDADELLGFFEQVSGGKLTLLNYPFIHLKRANFNVAMNTGTKDDELIKKSDWFIAQAGKATKFSPGKKTLLELMADKKEQVEAFLKTEKPDLKTRSGLAAVVAYYNRL